MGFLELTELPGATQDLSKAFVNSRELSPELPKAPQDVSGDSRKLSELPGPSPDLSGAFVNYRKLSGAPRSSSGLLESFHELLRNYRELSGNHTYSH